jgi:hypothetical protein
MFDRIGDITQLRQKLVGYVEAPAIEKREPGKAGKSPKTVTSKPRGKPKA